jgi:hypothetical protein
VNWSAGSRSRARFASERARRVALEGELQGDDFEGSHIEANDTIADGKGFLLFLEEIGSPSLPDR